MIIASGLEIRKTAFDDITGGQIRVSVPADCDLVILAGNKGGGYKPYSCRLPGQVYVKDLKEAFDRYHFEVIHIMPVRSGEVVPIAYANSYGKQRWARK